jgi:RimJ/RimL family protein N-acetyltransferase
MAGILIGLAAIAVGFYLIASAQQRDLQRRSGVAELARRVPTVTIDGFTARRAITADVDRAIEAMDQTFLQSNGWTNKMRTAAAKHLRRKDPDELGYITVCHSNDLVIGWGIVDRVVAEQARCALGFSLHPTARSSGLGTGALNAVVQSLHQAGVRTIELGTAESNHPMVKCIINIGAVQVRHGPTRLPDGSEPMSLWFEHTADQ